MVTGTASISVEVHFNFEKFDSVDRDYVSMGTAVIPEDVEVEFKALVTLEAEPSGLALGYVELLPTSHRLYFNDIEPGWMSDSSSYDPYD